MKLNIAGRYAVAFCLLAAPLALTLGWFLNYATIAEFFDFRAANPYVSGGRSAAAIDFARMLKSADGGFRLFALPHIIIYAAMNLFLIVAAYLGWRTYPRSPRLAAAGTVATAFGALSFAAVLGIWFAFANFANLADSVDALAPLIERGTAIEGVLAAITALSLLLLFGLILLGIALWRSGLGLRWSAIGMICGSIVIGAFAGTENFMSLGALALTLAMVPLALDVVRVGQREAAGD